MRPREVIRHDSRHPTRSDHRADRPRDRSRPRTRVHPARLARRKPHHHRRHWRRNQARGAELLRHSRGRAGSPDHEAVQARQPRVSQGRHGSVRGQGEDRRRQPRHDRRTVRRRELRGDGHRGPVREGRRREHPPRRGLQAAHQPVRLPRAKMASRFFRRSGRSTTCRS